MALIRFRRGGALTSEAAMLLPILVLVLLTGLESGWLAWRSRQIEGAAQRGVAVASTWMGTASLVDVAVADSMERAGLAGSGYRITVSPENLDATPGTAVTVTISVPYRRVSLTRLARLPFLPRRISSEASLPKEGPHFGSRTLAFAP